MSKKSKYNNGGSSEQFHSDDSLFDYTGSTTWKPNRKFAVQKSQFTIIDPKQTNFNKSDPKQLDFEIASTKTLLMSPMFRFEVKGKFMRQKPPTKVDGAPDVVHEAEAVPAADAANVYVQPNWLDFLIKSIEVYSGQQRLTTCSEEKALTPHINTFINSYMDKDLLNLTAPQEHHPYRYCPSFDKDKLVIGSQQWSDYSKLIFTGKEITIDYYPRVFPFVQSINKFDKSDASKHLPMPLLGKLNVRVTFADDVKSIFQKVDNNTYDYWFEFEQFRLIVEEANLNLASEKALFTTKKTLVFPGVCRISKIESLPANTPSFRSKFMDTMLPEGLMIMAVNKKIMHSQYSWAKDKDAKNMFLPHNIKKVELSFNNLSFDIKEPMFGNVEQDLFDVQSFFNHMKCPIFGVKPDMKNLKLTHFEEAGDKSSYPHIYLPLTQYFGDKWTRKVPALDDGSCLTKMSALESHLTFDAGGSVENAVYVFVIFFTDYCMAYDPKNKVFISPHGLSQG